jgi:cytochrome c-type biogenesis protein
MSGVDIALGFLAGVVSCLTPEALLLLPLLPAAAGARDRLGVIAIAVGLGLAQVLTGTVTSGSGAVFGVEAIWLREIVCGLLVLQGLILMRPSTVERFTTLTGGLGQVFESPGGATLNRAFRLLVLALFVGANWWHPVLAPTLLKANMMAAAGMNTAVAVGMLFVFGMGAAAPWILLGRVVRLGLRGIGARGLDGMAGKRILGVTFLFVAVLGISGLDATMAHALNAMLPAWMKKMAVTF